MATATATKKGAKLPPMGFERGLVLDLFRAIGIKGAAKETNEVLSERLVNLADSLSEEALDELEAKNETAHELATSVLECLGRNQPVGVIDDEEEDEEDTDLAEDDDDGDDSQAEADEDEDEEDEDEEDDSEAEDDESDEESDDSDEEDDDTDPEEEDDDVDETPAPKKKVVATAPKKPTGKPAVKPAVKSAAKPVAKPAAKPAVGKKPAAKDKEAKPKKPGVIQEMLRVLSAASKKAPVTKAKIHAHLTKTFRDRNPDSMLATLNAQVPTGLMKEKGITVKSVKTADDKTGYYIADWGGYKLPKA